MEVRCVREGDIRVMVPDLLFKGLKTLEEEDKDIVSFTQINSVTKLKNAQICPQNFSASMKNEPILRSRWLKSKAN